MNIESVKLLRDTANNILVDYCNKTGENLNEIKKFVSIEIDEFNLKLPIDYYLAYYNYCINNFKIAGIYYSDDVSILDHASFIVFDDLDGEITAIHISKYENIIEVYTVELFNKVSDSWINKDDLKSLNNSCDTDYKFDSKLSDIDSYRFSQDLCWYYGANNFDSYPFSFDNEKEFEDYLKDNNLIQKK